VFVGRVSRNISFGNGRWVGVGASIFDAKQSVQISTDSINWVDSTNGGTDLPTINTIAWNGSYWLVGGFASLALNTIQKSTDGFNWIKSLVNTGNDFRSFAWNGSVWIACGGIPIQRSTDGLRWSVVTTDETETPRVTWTGTKFITSGSFIQSSTDGTTWTSNAIFNNDAGLGAQDIATGTPIIPEVSTITSITPSKFQWF
jgi:hypothetical protein